MVSELIIHNNQNTLSTLRPNFREKPKWTVLYDKGKTFLYTNVFIQLVPLFLYEFVSFNEKSSANLRCELIADIYYSVNSVQNQYVCTLTSDQNLQMNSDKEEQIVSSYLQYCYWFVCLVLFLVFIHRQNRFKTATIYFHENNIFSCKQKV